MENLTYSTFSAEQDLMYVENPMDCILRFKQLVLPVGYIDAENLKKTICQYIDDSGLISF